jgi:3',5'-cyclic AMP phosphodiesterase CpdA
MKQNARWLIIAALVWLGAWAVTRWQRAREPAVVARPTWQKPVSELSEAQRAAFLRVREAIVVAETARSTNQAWPDAFLPNFVRTTAGLHTTYVGEAEGLRWLVLFLEPDPRLGPEDAGLDDEHHRLADGTALHVTVWTQGLDVAPPTQLVAFPAVEGWTERVR